MCFYDITRNHNPRSPKIGQYLAVPRGNVHEFKRSKRYIKTVSMDVISLGFPEQTVPKWLNGYVFVQEGQIRCRMRKEFDEGDDDHGSHDQPDEITRLEVRVEAETV